MLAGHYSVGFLARSASRDVPLWVWFLAVQWLDVFFMIFVLLGVEKMRITPGFTESNALDLYYMPYTHSLGGALAFSLAFAVLVAAFLPAARRAGVMALLAAASLSHWFLDFLVHTPDLGLFDPDQKVGLGLWNHLAVELPLEIALVLGCAWLCARALPDAKVRKRIWIVAGALIVLQMYGTFGPVAHSPAELAITGLTAYVAMIGAAYWVERPASTRQKSISSAP
jgi:hypothetical protein